MGLHDREWYQKELEKKGGQPMTFDQKAAAGMIARSPSKKASINNPHPNNSRVVKPVYYGKPQKQWSPVILGVVTVFVLAVVALSLKFWLSPS